MVLQYCEKNNYIDIKYDFVNINETGKLFKGEISLQDGYIPLQKYSVLAQKINYIINKYRFKYRENKKTEITQKIILTMKDLCEKNGDIFVLSMILSPQQEVFLKYKDFALKNNIKFLDCNIPLTKEFELPYDLHPNAKWNMLWAKRMISELKENRIIFNE